MKKKERRREREGDVDCLNRPGCLERTVGDFVGDNRNELKSFFFLATKSLLSLLLSSTFALYSGGLLLQWKVMNENLLGDFPPSACG